MSRLFFILLLLHTISFKAQEVEQLMTKKYIPCEDIILNATTLIPEYYQKNKTDTLTALIHYWEEQCGINESLLRLKILLAIEADTMNEAIYENVPVIAYLNDYRRRVRFEKEGKKYAHYYWSPPVEKKFDAFIQQLAEQLQAKKSYDELSQFFIDFYANDFDGILYRLQDSSLAETEIGKVYEEAAEYYLNEIEGHFSLYSGMWIPRGNIDVLGIHPMLGFQVGYKKRKLLLDFAIEIRFGRAANDFFVLEEDSVYKSSHFFGGLIGIESGYELFRFKSHEIDLLGGVAYEGADILEIGDFRSSDYVSKSINTLNLNIGFGYRFYLKNKSYLGLEGRYNVVNYKNTPTDLSGNTITVRLKYGISRNKSRDRNLLLLDHEVTNDFTEQYKEWLKEN